MDGVPCTVLIPAAGDSVRFKEKTQMPKGLIRFEWRKVLDTMIGHCTPVNWIGDVVVACKNADKKMFESRLVCDVKGNSKFEVLGIEPTSGQAETVAHMVMYCVRKNTDLLIINCDNAFDAYVLEDFVKACRKESANFGALTFMPQENKERYGYVDKHPYFNKGAEKIPVSSYALAGAFYMNSHKTLTKALSRAEEEVSYLSQLFQYMDEVKLSIVIPKYSLHEWGTPETLEADGTVVVDWSNL